MTSTFNPWPKSRFRIPEITPITTYDFADIVAFENDDLALYDPKAAQEYIQKQIESGVFTKEQINAKPPEPTDQNTNPAKDVTPTTISCDGSDVLSDYPPSLQLSKHFNLGQLSNKIPPGVLSSPSEVVAQRGLTKGQIVCNLKLLATNTLDPIKDKYPNMFVTNAFRRGSGKSQHQVGQAADLQFSGASKSSYYDIAVWIKDNISYDQLLLEYKTTGTGNPWIHVSFNSSGNRPPSNSSKVMTFFNNNPQSSGLKNLA